MSNPSDPRPSELCDLPASRQVHLDVRETIGRGEEPFDRIMGTVRQLHEDQVFVLRAPFEPIPLYTVLSRQGFDHWAHPRGLDDWTVWFYRRGTGPTARESTSAPLESSDAAGRRLDVRGLEPPEPLMRVLEAADALTPGEALDVIHDRRPVLLYPHVEERGLEHETHEPAPGRVHIRIWRIGSSADR